MPGDGTAVYGTGPRPAGLVDGILRGGPGRRQIGIALGAVAVLVVVVVLWASAGSDPDGAATAATSPVTASAPPSSAPPRTPTPTPTVTVTRTPTPVPTPASPVPTPVATGWQARLVAFSQAVLKQEHQRGIHPEVARKVRERIVKMAWHIQKGEEKGARKELQRIARELAEARRRGELAPHGPLIDFLRAFGFSLQGDDRDRWRGGHEDDEDDEDDD